jgi:DNA-binding GntR family transcriptional regulator
MPSPPAPFDLKLAREAFENAARLHGEATRRGAPNLTGDDLEQLREADAAFASAVADGRVEDAIEADDAFHRILVTAARDPDLQVSVELLTPRLRRMDLWFFARKTFGGAPNSHPPILAALERGDAEEAAELVERSFRDAGEQLSAALER